MWQAVVVVGSSGVMQTNHIIYKRFGKSKPIYQIFDGLSNSGSLVLSATLLSEQWCRKDKVYILLLLVIVIYKCLPVLVSPWRQYYQRISLL